MNIMKIEIEENYITVDGVKYLPEIINKTYLEVGKWYKRLPIGQQNEMLFCFTGSYGNVGTNYGINCSGKWSENLSVHHESICTEATEQEVFEALKNEAVKRGFGKKGVYFKDGSVSKAEVSEIDGFDFWNFDKYKGKDDLSKFNISVGTSECVIFRGTTGKWAEIIPTITKAKAEALLNKKIV